MWVNQPNWGDIQYQRDRENDARVEKQQRIDLFNSRLQDQFAKSLNYGKNYASSIGLNAEDPKILDIINQVNSNIYGRTAPNQDTNINPYSFFSPEAYGEGFADYQSRARRANTARVRESFAPGYENSLLPDKNIDDIVNQIIGEQKNLASTSLDYQSKRGLLTPKGSEQAIKSLAGQESAARGTVSGLARGALDKDRASLKSIIAEADSAANNWMLGNPDFDVTPFRSRLTETAQRESAGFGGDVRAALGNTQLFDIPSIVAQAGAAQGAQNLNVGTEVAPPGGKRKSGSTNRGLGSAGGGF